MTSQLLLGTGDGPPDRLRDDLKARAEFQRRMGNGYTIDDLIEDIQGVAVDLDNRIAAECNLDEAARANGTNKCEEIVDGADCHACQAYQAGLALDCGIGEKARKNRKVCASDDDCAECRLYDERLRRDCQMPTADRVSGRACVAPEIDDCAACAEFKANAEHEKALAEAARPIEEDGAKDRIDALKADLAAALLRLDCGLERSDGPIVCRLAADHGPAGSCAECRAYRLARVAAAETEKRHTAEKESTAFAFDLGMMRDRATTAEEALAAALAGKAPPAKRLGSHGKALRGQASLFDAAVASVGLGAAPGPAATPSSVAAAVTPEPTTPAAVKATGTRPGCTGGCNAYGRHRATCALARGKATA